MLKREEIRIRDPFIFVDEKESLYYLYGTTALEPDSILAGNFFDVYVSKDLELFDGPYCVFDGTWGPFWADRDFWAPEMHLYKGKYYLIGSFKTDGHCRGTQILKADSPMGPFAPISEQPQTPIDWECLDGTLWIEGETPYLVFCHEWLQTVTGEMCAVELSEDLSRPVGEPFVLFRATDNPVVEPFAGPPGEKCSVTDAPWLYRENGKLKMLWSSYAENHRYVVLEAEADSIRGPWMHKAPRFSFDGGHAMLFVGLDGKRRISLHRPNISPFERPVFMPFDKDQV